MSTYLPPNERKWPDRNEAHALCGMTWPRLLHLRHEVKSHDAPKVPGKVRAIFGKERSNKWNYHPDDLAELADAPTTKTMFEATARQQGKKRRWFIAPRLVAEKLNCSISSVQNYRMYGIPWWKKKRKPIVKQFPDGPGRKDWFLAHGESTSRHRSRRPKIARVDLLS